MWDLDISKKIPNTILTSITQNAFLENLVWQKIRTLLLLYQVLRNYLNKQKFSSLLKNSTFKYLEIHGL